VKNKILLYQINSRRRKKKIIKELSIAKRYTRRIDEKLIKIENRTQK
jgi:hypothetical protein